MKICLIIHSLKIGGMERVMSKIANYLAALENVEVHLLLIGSKRQIDYVINSSVVIHKPGFRYNIYSRLLFIIKTIIYVREIIKEIKPDSILSFGEMWNNLVLIGLYKIKIPVYISDRSEPGKNIGLMHNYFRNKLYPKASGFIAQTSKAKDTCKYYKWNDNVSVIGNPITKAPIESSFIKDKIILSVGRLVNTKHFNKLIELFAQINLPEWKLIIIGGDSQRQNNYIKLKELIRKLKVEDKVILTGEIKNIFEFYYKSQIYAFTSSSEGFPNVVGEALSAGLPVVAFDKVAGIRDLIIDGKNGFLVPLFDFELFKKKVSFLMLNDNVRIQMGNYARTSVTDFADDIICEKYYNFICNKN